MLLLNLAAPPLTSRNLRTPRRLQETKTRIVAGARFHGHGGSWVEFCFDSQDSGFATTSQRRHGASLKHDVSVPVSALPTLIVEGAALVRRLAPEGDVVSYGHAGDGNLHFNVSQKPGADVESFMARAPALELALFDLVESLGGSISAEHGIGRLKAAEFARRADPVELAVMHELKRALDPKGIMNPGKVLCVR